MRELSSELVEKYEAECLEQGFKYLGRGSKSGYSLAKCLVCGDVDSYLQSAMRDGRVRCKACKITQYSNECLAQGFKYLGKVDAINTLCECMTCYHQDIYVQVNMRKGEVQCENCLIQKYKESVKQGWSYVDKSAIKKRTYIILKHNCSDNLVTVYSGAFLRGSYDCPHCMHSHFDEQSYFYIIKVTHDNKSIIKIGVANNTDLRFKQYGLPDDAKVEIVCTEPFTTKRLAIKFESTMKQALKDYKVDNDTAKDIFKDSGHTECFTEDSLNLIERLLTESSGGQSGEQSTE